MGGEIGCLPIFTWSWVLGCTMVTRCWDWFVVWGVLQVVLLLLNQFSIICFITIIACLGAHRVSRMGPFSFLGTGRLWALSKVENSVRVRASPSEVSPAGKFQWHFTCGFDFRHGLWLPFVAAFAVLRGLLMVPVGTMGPFWPGDSPFRALCMCMRGSLWAVSKIESSVRAPRLLRFILLGSWRR